MNLRIEKKYKSQYKYPTYYLYAGDELVAQDKSFDLIFKMYNRLRWEILAQEKEREHEAISLV